MSEGQEQVVQETQPNNLLIFGAAISKSFQDIAHCVSEEEFLKIFTMLESKSSVVKKLHKVMEDDLFKSMDEDLQAIVTEECMVDGMKKVANLIEDTTVPPSATLWRPPGDVKLHLRSLDAEKILKQCENLESYICKIEKENETIKNQVTKRRKSVQSVSNHMKQLLNMPFKLSELENTVKYNQECVEKLYDNS
ncbi:hypothetical protein TSAR_000829 [Trichomalopsis sarcophagae]|uniref:Uncharacterized protein n=1 Tax=Trichomalopsis sarcophagae TaxID=543379 RepID=A0A232FGL0_9HYME|nr:hypothetical protein TSAR_000829 [Trichomalopsis sarcophagae]